MDSIMTYGATLSKNRNCDDVEQKAKLHAIGMISDVVERLDEKTFNGSKKLQIRISVIDQQK